MAMIDDSKSCFSLSNFPILPILPMLLVANLAESVYKIGFGRL